MIEKEFQKFGSVWTLYKHCKYPNVTGKLKFTLWILCGFYLKKQRQLKEKTIT